MESEILKYLWLIVLTLVQIIYIWMKIAERRNGKKENNPGNYGVKIGKLETEVENIKEDIREIKRRLNRK